MSTVGYNGGPLDATNVDAGETLDRKTSMPGRLPGQLPDIKGEGCLDSNGNPVNGETKTSTRRPISDGHSTFFSLKGGFTSGGGEPNSKNGKNKDLNIFYSDKSESSVEDLMDVTPTDFNTANGRLEGKSAGMRKQA